MVGADQAFVAIIGGFFNLDNVKKTRAKEYASDIGKALAQAGLGLVVYFSDEESLEPHVVAGYVAALPSDAPPKCIRVRYPESQKDIVRFKEQDTRPLVFEPKLMPLNDWEAPFYRSLVEPGGADAVLLMAGNRSVLIAGQIVVARRLPTLALDNFDGSAAVIWRELSQTGTDYPTATNSTPTQLVAWLKAECEARAAERKAQALERQRVARLETDYARLTSSTQSTWLTGVGVLLLLGIIVFGVRQSPPVDSYAMLMFVGLVVAGATGALARALMWGRSTAITTSLLLGGLAGLLVGMAYLVPQLIGAPGVFSPNATAVAATDKIQFVSALLTAFSAGVGFDTVFNRIKDRATQLPIEPEASKLS
jgi:hypothetical protein